MDPRILELTRRPPHFAYEAYEFVCEAVTFTQQRLGRGTGSGRSATGDFHITGGELLRGVCDLAVQSFGMMASIVFKHWNVRTTDDIGRIVFDLISIGRLTKSDRDSPEDFHDVFDLHQALQADIELDPDETTGTNRGER